ncbi:mediator of RNA polymerase II transcription subunit 16-like isoform X2 [Actinia tenebrosa]|uniref:Mediator of RNA polymerase II transcription subunit 16 n=1 Tax=Actinia tenebrosa TaxID=6105 RepID=A0A6P8HB34_ACTTE|nr:mediator of RNA polymerase II transcription subunit 16-like isoform X2 [Actinia tenebrosa]
MDLLYSTVWETAKKSQRDACGKVTVSWSHRNLIAFTSGYKKIQDNNDKKCLYNALHILDPDTPWDVCSFDSHHKELIQKIVWDSTGARLLSVDLQGQCNVWTMKDNLVNDWQCKATANVGEGERLVAVSWIDNGIKVMFSPSSSDDHASKRSFEEQFKSSSNKPPYTEFGGKAQDGWVAVTESGLFCVTTLKPDVKIARKNLSSIRRRVAFADLAYTSQGKVIVAANDGEKSTSVQFYRMQIKSQNNTCQIETFSLPCLFPHSRSELQEISEYTVSEIQFLSKNSGEIVLVCTVGLFGTCIKKWVMRKERIEKFQKRWSCLTSHMDSAQLISLTLPRLPVTVDVSQTLMFPVLAIAASYDDDRIELINSHTLSRMSSHQSQAKGIQSVEPPSKKAKTHQLTQTQGTMCCMSFSPCSCCLVGVSCTGDLSVFKIQPTEGTPPNRFKRNLVDLMEYCLVAGWEWWDIMVAAHLGAPADMAESVLKLLLEDFNQVQLLQQYIPHMLIHKLMAVKASLYRCMKDGSGQAMDCYASQFLYSVTMLFRSLPTCTQNTMEQLTKVCTARTTDVDIDKVILSLDSKEYTVEAGILTAVHPLIQWITDLAMFVIAAFTTRHTKDSVPGVSLGHNPEVLGLLKEMLVLIKIWGQTMSSIVPSITPSADKKDSLALLFKIITKMWLHSKQPGEGQEIEDRLAVEASPLLPNQLFVVNMKAPNLNRGVIGKPVSGPIKASVYQFNNRPMGASVCHSYHPFASAVLPIAPESAYNLDVIRRVFIDSGPDIPLKQCTRCSCVSQLNGPSNQNIVLKTWEQRWVKSCVCGGSWKKYQVQ